MFTLITPRTCEPELTKAAERTPLVMTVAPLATGGTLPCVGAPVINKRAAWHGIEGFSW